MRSGTHIGERVGTLPGGVSLCFTNRRCLAARSQLVRICGDAASELHVLPLPDSACRASRDPDGLDRDDAWNDRSEGGHCDVCDRPLSRWEFEESVDGRVEPDESPRCACDDRLCFALSGYWIC